MKTLALFCTLLLPASLALAQEEDVPMTTTTTTTEVETPVATPTPTPAVAKQTTTTTTSTTAAEDVKIQEGIVSELNPGSGLLKLATDDSSVPMVFHFTEETAVVDITDSAFELGNVKLGRVVTVHYLPKPGELAATRIVVGDAPTLDSAAPATTTVTESEVAPATPMVEEKSTTTTTTTTEE